MFKKFSILLILILGTGFLIFSVYVGNIDLKKKSRIHRSKGFKKNLSKLQILHIPTPKLPKVIDPQKVLSHSEKSLLSLIYGKLVKVDENLQVEPDLLKSWELDFEKIKFRLNLRRALTFNNGQKITSNDIYFSFHQWAKSKSLDSDLLLPIIGVKEYQSGKKQKIDGINIIDNYTIDVTLSFNSSYFIRSLTNSRFVVYPNNYNGMKREEYLNHPIASGPFNLEYKSKKRAKFVANPLFYLGKPHLNIIQIEQMNVASAIKKFHSGEINNLIFYNIWDSEQFNAHNIIIAPKESKTSLLLFLSPQFKPFKNKKTREEFSNFIKTNVNFKSCYKNMNMIDNIIPEGLIGSRQSNKKNVRLNQDFKYKQSHNIKLNVPNIIFYIEDLKQNSCLDNVLDSALKDTNVKLKKVSFYEMYEKLKAKNLYTWIETWEFKNEDPISNLQYFSTTSNEYLLGEKIPKLEAFFKKLQTEVTESEKARIYSKIDNFLTSNYYVVPLLNPIGSLIFRDIIKGINQMKLTSFFSGWHNVYIE